MSERVLYCIWDTNTDRRAGIGSYFSQEQAEAQIRYCKERQARGGRPDIDPSGYVVRVEDEFTRRWGN